VVYLIRHAQSIYDPSIPEQERSLSLEGKKQAIDLIKKLTPLRIEKIYSSPAKRAIDTIAPFAQTVGLNIELVPEFKECKMLPCKSFEEWYAIIKKSWDDFTFKPKNWESNLECQARICKKIDDLRMKHSDVNIAISSHGRVLSLLLNKIDKNWGFDKWKDLPMPSIIKVCFKTGSIFRLC